MLGIRREGTIVEHYGVEEPHPSERVHVCGREGCRWWEGQPRLSCVCGNPRFTEGPDLIKLFFIFDLFF